MDYETSKNKLSTKCIDRIVIYITEIVEKLIESKDFSDSTNRYTFKKEDLRLKIKEKIDLNIIDEKSKKLLEDFDKLYVFKSIIPSMIMKINRILLIFEEEKVKKIYELVKFIAVKENKLANSNELLSKELKPEENKDTGQDLSIANNNYQNLINKNQKQLELNKLNNENYKNSCNSSIKSTDSKNKFNNFNSCEMFNIKCIKEKKSENLEIFSQINSYKTFTENKFKNEIIKENSFNPPIEQNNSNILILNKNDFNQNTINVYADTENLNFQNDRLNNLQDLNKKISYDNKEIINIENKNNNLSFINNNNIITDTKKYIQNFYKNIETKSNIDYLGKKILRNNSNPKDENIKLQDFSKVNFNSLYKNKPDITKQENETLNLLNNLSENQNLNENLQKNNIYTKKIKESDVPNEDVIKLNNNNNKNNFEKSEYLYKKSFFKDEDIFDNTYQNSKNFNKNNHIEYKNDFNFDITDNIFDECYNLNNDFTHYYNNDTKSSEILEINNNSFIKIHFEEGKNNINTNESVLISNLGENNKQNQLYQKENSDLSKINEISQQNNDGKKVTKTIKNFKDLNENFIINQEYKNYDNKNNLKSFFVKNKADTIKSLDDTTTVSTQFTKEKLEIDLKSKNSKEEENLNLNFIIKNDSFNKCKNHKRVFIENSINNNDIDFYNFINNNKNVKLNDNTKNKYLNIDDKKIIPKYSTEKDFYKTTFKNTKNNNSNEIFNNLFATAKYFDLE